MKQSQVRILDNHWGLRALAFVVAVSLWMFVGLGPQQHTARRKVELNIEVRNPPGSQHWETVPGSVEVVLEGAAGPLANLDVTSLHAFVDVDPLLTSQAATVSVSTPAGIKLDQVSPAQVHLTVVR